MSQEVRIAVNMMIMNARYTPVDTSGRVEFAWIPRAMADPTRVPIWKILQNREKLRPLARSSG